MPPSKSQTRALVLAVLASIALVVNGASAVVHIRRVAATNAWVTHTHEVLATAQSVLASLQDAETGQRGYLLTGDLAYLEPYGAGARTARGRLERLEALTRDDPEQQRRVAELRPLVEQKLAELGRTVALRSAGRRGFDEARAVVAGNEGKLVMDALRLKVGAFTAREQGLLEDRSRASASAVRSAIVAAVIGVASSVVLLGFAFEASRRRTAERERAATMLHEEKERFRTTLASIGDAVIVTDRTGHITMLNPAAKAITGWGDDAVGRPLAGVFRIVNEQTRRTVDDPVSRVLREGATVGLANHTVLVRRDGAERPIDDSGAPVRDEDGAIVGVVLVFRDVTDRREAERKLERHAEQLREQDRRKDEFLAILSHELRSPLSPIRNALAVLQRSDPAGDQAERARVVIERQVSQMVRLVDDLLDVARVTQGKIRLERGAVRLADVVRRTVEDHRPTFQRARVLLELEEPDEGVWVDADAGRLAQVVGNLLQNAVKFTPRGGRVTVALDEEGGAAVLRVRDDGAGMDAAALASLFQPFMQADRTLARTQGLGLGLALAKSLVELHGGTLDAASEGVGKGAEFVARLPAVAAPAARPNLPARASAGGPLRIVLIEDNEDAAATLCDVLELEGHHVVVAPDGHRGIDAALSERPDVVLCDLGLPDMDGLEIAPRLRASGLRARLVAITGYASPADAERALAAGFDAHVAKPFDLDRLSTVLRGADEPSQPSA
jgi:PAS domain S-box-containing protein